MHRFRRAAFFIIALGFCMLGCSAHSAEPATREGNPAAANDTPQLQRSTERLVVFKDGYGLVVQKGVAKADEAGRVFTREVPDSAVLGCFWAISEDKKILGMQAEWEQDKQIRKTDSACLTVPELLRANVGKTVTLQLTDKTEKGNSLVEDGKIVEMLDLPAEADAAPSAVFTPMRDMEDESSSRGVMPGESYTSLIRGGATVRGSFGADSMIAGDTLVREIVPRGGELVAIEREGTRIVMPVAHIQGISGKDIVTRMSRQEEVLTKSKRLSFNFGKESAGKNVSLHVYFFTPGLRWIPTYRVSGKLEDTADLSLQGEIVNDVIDVKNAPLDLVVGVPNFKFKSTVSPLTLERTARIVLQSAFDNRSNSMMNAQFSNADMSNERAAPVQPGGAMDLAPELAGSGGEQDLFVYNIKEFSLKKGGRATAPIWEQPAVPLRHIYTYDISAHRDRAAGAVGRSSAMGLQSPAKIEMNQVWHQLELGNNGTMPWTTGAALMLRDMLPLGQDLITYTPPGGKALLPVTIAVDIRGKFDEQETDRKANALHFDGVDFAQVTKKGTITVTSFRKDKCDVRVTVASGGKISGASDNGEVRINDFRAEDWDDANLMRVNNHSDAAWEFTIEPGKTKTLTFDVTFYVR